LGRLTLDRQRASWTHSGNRKKRINGKTALAKIIWVLGLTVITWGWNLGMAPGTRNRRTIRLRDFISDRADARNYSSGGINLSFVFFSLGIMKRQMELSAQRGDLSQGISWDQQDKMKPQEIRERDVFPVLF